MNVKAILEKRFRPLSGYSFSNEIKMTINETNNKVFVPSRGIRFLMRLEAAKLGIKGTSKFSSPLGVFVF